MTIRCIAFDLDDTLWACHPVIVRAEQRFYEWLKRYYPKIPQKYSEAALISHRMTFMQSHPDNRHDLTYLRKRWMELLADEVEYNYDLVDPGFEITFFDGTLDILEELSTKYSLGVISNGNADVNHIGAGHLFDFTLSSESAGVSKPHPDIFDQAIKLSGFNKEQTVYVGDDAKRDIVGAQSAGIKGIWFNPKLTPWPKGKTPFAVIQHLNELENIVINA